MDALLIIAIAIAIIALVNTALLVALLAGRSRETGKLIESISDEQRELRGELSEDVRRSVRALGEGILGEQQRMNSAQETRFKTFAVDNENKLENIRKTVSDNLSSMQRDNNKKLDEMRGVVDEKLQKTLDERFTRSFALVNERLEQVYKGLGEMRSLASDVGDLSKVLSNVKTRGIIGEVQLGAILAEIMTPEQYLVDTAVKAGASERVEYAIKLPADGGQPVLLPIDSKFPMDAYTALIDAYESGTPASIHAAREALRARVRGFGKDIRDKYVCPPETTDFAIMFLPTEGLYAEVMKLGMMETLQSEFRVNVAGPSTMAALLNSLQMGFRSVAIQKRSGEVWKVLGAVRTEFDKFEEILTDAQKRLDRVHGDLDKLIGVRARGIRRSLKDVISLPEDDAARLIDRAASVYSEEDEPGA